MFNGNKILALIPARGGSKGIKNKNIIDLNGKPLLAYSIEACKKSKYIDDIILSTDSQEIASIGELFGAEVPFLRPSELASDTSKTIDVVIHAINWLKKRGREYNVLSLIQPTQPLRTENDIDAAIDIYFSNGEKDLVSVCEVDDNPILIRTIEGDKLKPITNYKSTWRRQDMPRYYKVNGCIYLNAVDRINSETSFNDNELPYIMERSHSIDIDEYIDLEVAKILLNTPKEI